MAHAHTVQCVVNMAKGKVPRLQAHASGASASWFHRIRWQSKQSKLLTVNNQKNRYVIRVPMNLWHQQNIKNISLHSVEPRLHEYSTVHRPLNSLQTRFESLQVVKQNAVTNDIASQQQHTDGSDTYPTRLPDTGASPADNRARRQCGRATCRDSLQVTRMTSRMNLRWVSSRCRHSWQLLRRRRAEAIPQTWKPLRCSATKRNSFNTH